jgi:peptide/nickel transport system substrate-binding protein
MRSKHLKALALMLVMLMALGVVGGVSAQDEVRELNLIYWQAPSTMNPYLSGGTKEVEAASVVLEPLARYDETGALVPWLVDEIPTVENGGVSEDLTQITWVISEGITWSDGTPLTAADAVFTWEYCTNEATGCAQIQKYEDVATVEAVDERTIVVTFEVPKPFPYGPFVGAQAPLIQAAQFADCVGAAAQECTDQNFAPIGTGAFVVDDFRANDVIVYVRNENYREEGKPYFDRVVLQGGGDAESAARAVLETDEADYAWNLQIAPQILNQMEMAGEGIVVVAFGTSVERIMVNQTNPAADLGDMRSVWTEDGSNAHPFLTDPAVWGAMSMAIDRGLISEQLYGAAGQPTCNVLPAPDIYASTNNDGCLEQDIEGAIAMLEEAGWVDEDGDGWREKDGVELSVLYQTSTNAVRQSTQALIKQWWEQIGIETELRNISADVFFGGDPASPDTYGKFFADVEMYTNNFDGTDPEAYMNNWSCDNIALPENNFLGPNVARWCNADYDALLDEMAQTAVLEERAALAIQMNDLIVQNGALIPLVHRGDVSAHGVDIEGVRMNSWDSELWNIADWTRVDM